MYALEVIQEEAVMIQCGRKDIRVECSTQLKMPFAYMTKASLGILEGKHKNAQSKFLQPGHNKHQTLMLIMLMFLDILDFW